MKITVIGAGKSGLAASKLAKLKGNEVFLTESGIPGNQSTILQSINKIDIEYEIGGHTKRALDAELIVTSPGVPPHSEIIKSAEEKNIEIISELEFASRFLKNPIVAITGTNGKTTTTALTEFILNNGGKKAIACGNIGFPMSGFVDKIDDETILVVEASSYQLDRVSTFKPKVAIILNITPDHLSYHGSMDKYVESKWKISIAQSEENLLILNSDDKGIFGGNSKSNATKAFISMSQPVRGIYHDSGKIILNFGQHNNEELMYTSELSLPGIHNTYNSMAAALAARAFEIRNEDIRDSLAKFKGVEHRLEFVRKLNEVDYINDSKATNVNATWYALASYNTPIIWIAGGRGDSNDYSSLDESVKKNVASIIAIGEEKENIFSHFASLVRCYKEGSLEEAVRKAYEIAEPGMKVLFTPACKSFDMFLNFEHRGEVFKSIVNSL